MTKTWFKVTGGILLVVILLGCSTLLATIFATRQISGAIRQSIVHVKERDEKLLEGMKTLDFYEATGINQSELADWFGKLRTEQQFEKVRLILTMSDKHQHCLVDRSVALKWANGEEWTLVGSSGLAEFALSDAQLDQLQVIVPEEFTTLRQRTFDLGTSYEQPPAPVAVNSGIPAVNDDAIQQNLFRSLQKIRSTETVFARLNGQQSLRRPITQLSLPQARGHALTAEQVYENCRPSVVVVGLLQPDGLVTQGTGFIVGPNVVATNFHVLDKPHSVAAGVLTSDLRFFDVKEFLAGSPADDLALIRIGAADLPVLPLAETDTGIGTDVMALTHPDSHYFSMTFGRTTRYFQTTRHALPSMRMGVTSDFSDGSSGGPVLDMFGNVVGIVSATRSNSTQMVHREAIPVSSLRKLLGHLETTPVAPTFPSITLSQPTK